MRTAAFCKAVQDQFNLLFEPELAKVIAEAMHNANNEGMATFSHDGEMYTIAATWLHGCINYDCNPATCWTNWEIRAW